MVAFFQTSRFDFSNAIEHSFTGASIGRQSIAQSGIVRFCCEVEAIQNSIATRRPNAASVLPLELVEGSK
jgi:hypothetical protein